MSIAAMHGELDTANERGTQAPDGPTRAAARQEAEIGRLHARIARLEREKAAKDSILAVAAHELLTPVIMIDAYATMVSERLDEEHHAESRRDLEALHRGAARTRLLVETLLNDAQAEGRALRRRPIDVDVLVHECTTLLAPEIRARDADVQVAPLPCIRGEETLIGAVFSNLLVNALKYGPRERGRVLVEATPDQTGWRFSVQSQGAPDSAAGPRPDLRAVPPRARRAPRAGRRPWIDDLPEHRRASRWPDRRHGLPWRREPLLLQPAGLSCVQGQITPQSEEPAEDRTTMSVSSGADRQWDAIGWTDGRRRRMFMVVGLIALAVLVGVTAVRGQSEDPSDVPDRPGPVRSGPLTLSPLEGWRATTSIPRLEGLDFHKPVVLRERTSGTRLVAGRCRRPHGRSCPRSSSGSCRYRRHGPRPSSLARA